MKIWETFGKFLEIYQIFLSTAICNPQGDITKCVVLGSLQDRSEKSLI